MIFPKQYRTRLLSILLIFTATLFIFKASFAQQHFVVGKISISGNKITRERIIHRELNLKEGDTIPADQIQAKLDRMKFNVTNTLLFIFVNIDTVSMGGNALEIKVNVKERWYIFPTPIILTAERNFSSWLVHKDITRLDYGLMVIWKNFTGNRDRLKAIAKYGFNEQYYLEYAFPFLNKAQTIGIFASCSFVRNHEIPYYSENNKLLFERDNKKYIRREWEADLGITYRHGLYNVHQFDVSYLNTKVEDTIIKLNPNFFNNGSNLGQYFSLTYNFKRDLRDYKIFPLTGYYIEAEASKLGIGVLKNEVKAQFYASIKATRHWVLTDGVYFQLGAKVKLGSSVSPYYTRYGLGYELDFVRGYERNVFEGRYFGYLKSNLKFALFKDKIYKLKFIKTEKFNTIPVSLFFNLHTDFGYVNDVQWKEANPMNNTFLMGSGLGFELLTYYDKLWRLEYSVTRQGKSGLFLTFFAAF